MTVNIFKPSGKTRVDRTPELDRILQLPRRQWTEQDAVELAEKLSDYLRIEGGSQTLRPAQAIALHDLAINRGLICTARVGAGKAQPNDEPVLAEHGWSAIGSLAVGDKVFGSDGLLHSVLGVFPQGVRPVYKVVFSDGSWTLSDVEHLWTFRVSGRKTETKPLSEWMHVKLFRSAETGKGKYRINRLFLPPTSPIQRDARDLPLDPYTLGALIGDGGMTQRSVSFTSMDEDICSRLRLPDGLLLKETKHQNSGLATQYNITKGYRGGPAPNPLVEVLETLGLHGKDAFGKFIPPEYKLASIEQRLDLLRGLSDTDGCIARVKVEFSTVARRLAEDVVELVESLGGSAHLSIRPNHFRVHYSLPDGMNPFYCSRKAIPYGEALKNRQRKTPTRAVKSIEYVGAQECTCISVDAPDQLYVTRHHILTHNTLISFLAPYVTKAMRPLLLIPANLKTKTDRDLQVYRKHWEVSTIMPIMSYELLARANQNHYLHVTKPDLIICDEAHHLKNTKAAATKRIMRYLEQNPDTMLAFLSGTLANRSLHDFWHLVRAAFKAKHMPLPYDFESMNCWALALDETVRPEDRMDPGALKMLCNDFERELWESDPLKAARISFRRRFIETPGVVATKETFGGASLHISPIEVTPPKVIEDAFQRLQDENETPDGWDISDAHQLAAHARELALGFYYRWNPRPPQEWMMPRRAFKKMIRKVLTHNKRNLDTERQVCDAIEAGEYPKHEQTYKDWRAVEKTFEPTTEAVWLSSFALEIAMRWMRDKKGIVWVSHSKFGKELSKRSGVPYYGEGGFDANKNFIESHKAGQPMIASIKANKEGKNLQAWNENLVVNPPTSGRFWEQMLGRTHRDGQLADEVNVDVFAICMEHVDAFWRACSDASYVQDTQGQIQKLLSADNSMPSIVEFAAKPGRLHQKARLKESEDD